MKDSETRRLEMFIRARNYGAAHASAFPVDARGRELLAELDTVIADLEKHATGQASGTRAARESSLPQKGGEGRAARARPPAF